jgi:hypothetical protein
MERKRTIAAPPRHHSAFPFPSPAADSMWPQALSLLSFSSSSQFVNQLIIGLHYNCTELWEKLLNLEGGQLSPNNEAFFFVKATSMMMASQLLRLSRSAALAQGTGMGEQCRKLSSATWMH